MSLPRRVRRSGSANDCTKRHGTWYFVADVEPAPGGRRRQVKRGGFRTQADAAAALALVLSDLNRGFYRDDGGQRLRDYLPTWVEDKTAQLRPSTAADYRHHIEHYVVPALGHLRLAELRGTHVTKMLAQIGEGVPGRSRRAGPATLQRICATLRSALSDARRDGLVRHNAASDARVPAAVRPRVTVWEPAELGAFLDHVASDRLGPLFEVSAATGLRRGEICGLRWADVDLERARIVVRQQIVQVNGHPGRCPTCCTPHRGLVFGPPKTNAGESRIIDLDQWTSAALGAQRVRQDTERATCMSAYADHDLVFAREDGAPLRPEIVTATFSRLAREAGLRPVRLHDLRHGQASLLLAAGVPLTVVSKRLGHSGIGITSDTYSHLLGGMGRNAQPPWCHDVPVTSP